MNLLFDLDGTLADPIEAFASSMDYAFTVLNLPILPRDTLRSMIGPPLQVELPRVLGPIQSSLADEILQTYRRHHGEDGIYRYAFYSGMDDALAELRLNHRVFVATSKPKVYADKIFQHFGKTRYFEFIYGSELSGLRSKKGDLIRFAMTESALKPSETIMIGDRKHDLIGAQENGIRSLGVTWGYGSHEELAAAGPTAIAHSWNELLQKIGSL